PKHSVDELPKLPAALADERNDDHIRLDTACELRQERGLPDARAGEETDPLPADERQKRVKNGETGFQARPQTAPPGRGGRRGAQRPFARAAQERRSIDRPAEGIDDAADPYCDGSGSDGDKILDYDTYAVICCTP